MKFRQDPIPSLIETASPLNRENLELQIPYKPFICAAASAAQLPSASFRSGTPHCGATCFDLSFCLSLSLSAFAELRYESLASSGDIPSPLQKALVIGPLGTLALKPYRNHKQPLKETMPSFFFLLLIFGCHNPKGPCIQIAYTLAPMYLYREYLKTKVYAVWSLEYMDHLGKESPPENGPTCCRRRCRSSSFWQHCTSSWRLGV